jgi:tetratricopeptide (TPR) repeat protein
MGWTFTTTDQSEITTILQVVTEGICKIATILEDGYLNYRIDDYPYPYDYVTLEAALFDRDYVQGDSALGYSRWVPVCRLGFLLNESNQRADVGVNRGVVAEQFWVASDGAGMYVPNAINSLVFSTLIEAADWYTIDRLLDASVRMDVKNESTNSLSNWGIAKYKQGLISEAIEKFEAALQREDKFAEAEASYWLALIYEQNDDTKTAGIYRARCEAAGGYSEPQGVETLEVGLTKSNKQGLGEPVLSKQAAFCSQCGTQFKDDSARFCPNWGSAR